MFGKGIKPAKAAPLPPRDDFTLLWNRPGSSCPNQTTIVDVTSHSSTNRTRNYINGLIDPDATVFTATWEPTFDSTEEEQHIRAQFDQVFADYTNGKSVALPYRFHVLTNGEPLLARNADGTF